MGILVVSLTGCGRSAKSEVDDESALSTIRNAINKVYDNNEKLTTNNVQKYMVGNLVIVEAPENTITNLINMNFSFSSIFLLHVINTFHNI